MSVTFSIDGLTDDGLLQKVTCPHCWELFPPEDILWVSEHQDLLGDPKLGPEQQQRFLPSRFNVRGDAMDAKGFACHTLACPKCHLTVPRCMIELEPLFLSILGAPASGKSFYLASLTWELRKMLGQHFALSFSDADTVSNRLLNGYEESLFMNSDPNSLIPLGNLIRKTETQGDMYDTVRYGSQIISYPRPFLFAVQPQDGHPNADKALKKSRTICLYDNAGEHFEPGQDTTASPMTRHLAHAAATFFVFDPTQDHRFRQKCQDAGDGRLAGHSRTSRQEPVLQEAAARVRRYTGLRQNEKHSKPLIVVLTKFDTWTHLLPMELKEPWRALSSKKLQKVDSERPLMALELDVVKQVSQATRQLLQDLCPEIVNSAEAFASRVTYIPVSAVGWDTKAVSGKSSQTKEILAIRPSDAKPFWVTVPFMYALCLTTSGLLAYVGKKE